MKRLLFLLMAAMLLTACGKNEPKDEPIVEEGTIDEEESKEEYETLRGEEHNIVLEDNEDLRITLLESAHGRSDVRDLVEMNLEIENKQNRTFEMYVDNLEVDGNKIDSTQSWLSESEIEPNETITLKMSGYDFDELKFDEHVSGRIIYRDYEGNRNEITFSEYIND